MSCNPLAQKMLDVTAVAIVPSHAWQRKHMQSQHHCWATAAAADVLTAEAAR